MPANGVSLSLTGSAVHAVKPESFWNIEYFSLKFGRSSPAEAGLQKSQAVRRF